MKFYNENTRRFDIKGLKHAIRLWIIVLEISVLMAQFPSKEIAELSYIFRTLGLGYANLGAVLMRAGIPYDSDEGRAVCGALTAIMTGQSYATSSELAKHLGTFAGYEKNKNEMLRVIRNHRRGTYNVDDNEYEELSIKPIGIDEDDCDPELVTAARECWDEALYMGEQYGYRNAQVTVIAPTGTIGLVMDCDTTGIEPDYALVKFKKLAGGGYFKIINQSVIPALKALKYSDDQIKSIMDYILGTMTFDNAPFINTETLVAKGFTVEEIREMEQKIPKIFHILDLFAGYNMTPSLINKFKLTSDEINQANFNLLHKLGFKQSEIEAASETICGVMTIEGAPNLKETHIPIFDCANKCGKGNRFIHHFGHIKMMAAAQPFITGAISKTINMPNEITVNDIQEAYMLSWQLGLKANAIYRDGSKHTQAMYSGGNNSSEAKSDKKVEVDQEAIQKKAEELTAKLMLRGQKRDLPLRRHGITIEASIGPQKIHLRTGEYEDGSLGEIFIDMFKEGASYRSLLNSLAVAVSIGLQYGVPLEKFVDKFTFTRFEPSGLTNHPNIRTCTSIIDFIFRVLGMEYLNRMDFVHVPPVHEEKQIEISTPEQIVKISQARDKEVILTNEVDAVNKAEEKNTVDEYLKTMMGDAPICDICGHITIRNGACYKCLNCGNSLGCS
jgi:ribonucleoside-diphosphate reductase alpha chain